jgi:hypothetical protein
MDLTRLHVKVNVVTGKHTRKSLGNAAHFEAVDASASGKEIV